MPLGPFLLPALPIGDSREPEKGCGVRAAKRGGELHIDHNRVGKCLSCGFRTPSGESLV
jgi:hypothetical protein